MSAPATAAPQTRRYSHGRDLSNLFIALEFSPTVTLTLGVGVNYSRDSSAET